MLLEQAVHGASRPGSHTHQQIWAHLTYPRLLTRQLITVEITGISRVAAPEFPQVKEHGLQHRMVVVQGEAFANIERILSRDSAE